MDRWLGELSYPIYINHWLMVPLGAYLMDQWGLGGEQQNAAFITVLSVVFAIILNLFVADPIERLRNRIRGRPRFNPPAQNDTLAASRVQPYSPWQTVGAAALNAGEITHPHRLK